MLNSQVLKVQTALLNNKLIQRIELGKVVVDDFLLASEQRLKQVFRRIGIVEMAAKVYSCPMRLDFGRLVALASV